MYPIGQSLELEQLASSAKATHPLESNSVTAEEVNILIEMKAVQPSNLTWLLSMYVKTGRSLEIRQFRV